MSPYHIDPSNEVSLPGVQPPREPVMTFSAQRYDFRLRPPPAARISISSRSKQEELYIETDSVWSQSLGRISLISSTAVSVSTDGGRGFEWNSWARQKSCEIQLCNETEVFPGMEGHISIATRLQYERAEMISKPEDGSYSLDEAH
ncbi:hypothetical protein AGABI1DRAFT_125659 [Agaricus bisporus var. burnettii JB137-S8]|uniref:Uncharacterized protein n=1 Tax=Agaricus bisporus var. burnettii (strain JB137-S8 / ATCC MYA-4627 / FGSC 10392) TaxID=597362 RepID=K5XI80_AGABU|nr:uncharacterized protein AGABI1DRAFT_125659 [Agaricus bisporus var. burnettii JB137-S8]EKM83183.1 hypothetical protein AGABI1DRAFT_125659 [Agaricus bisporus var. burnettii JB137-S8]